MYQIILGDWIERVKFSNLSSKDKEKNILELCHLASFIISLKINGFIKDIDEVTIHEAIRESPDFIINYKGELVGLEIKRIKNDKKVTIGRLESLLSKSGKLFREKYPNINVLSNISFIDDFEFKHSDEVDIKNQIANYVYCTYSNNDCLKPFFIESIYCMNHSDVSFNLSAAYVFSESLNSGSINNLIKENEHYLMKYKINTDSKRIFLLLVVSMASPDSNYVDIEIPKTGIDTEFDSVFLLKDFYKEVYQIK